MINPHNHISWEPTIVLKTASKLPSCSQRASVSNDASGGAREIPLRPAEALTTTPKATAHPNAPRSPAAHFSPGSA